jgi:hypothetical protein
MRFLGVCMCVCVCVCVCVYGEVDLTELTHPHLAKSNVLMEQLWEDLIEKSSIL